MSLTLPHVLESERTLVGGVLLDPRAFVGVGVLVGQADFYHPPLGAIWRAMGELDAAHEPLEQRSIVEHMKTSETWGLLRAHGDEAYFPELTAEVVTVDNLAWHAKLVARKARARRLIEGFQELAAAGYRGVDPREIVERAEELLVGNAGRERAAPRKIGDVLPSVHETIAARYEHKGDVTGLATGFNRLDAMTAGLQPGDLVVVAARPSMGKSALAIQLAEYVAASGAPALFFSCEMLTPSLVERLLSGGARIHSTRLRTGLLEDGDWKALVREETRLGAVPLWIDDDASTLGEIRSKARLWRAREDQGGGLGDDGKRARCLVVVDYLQLVSVGSSTRKRRGREYTRENEVAEISRGLKLLAKELECPVVALAQLNRGLESRADKRPQLSDLRESGAIENDADVILFIYRDDAYNKASPDAGTAEIIVGKQRSGPVGTVRLTFLQQFTRFEDLEEDPQEALGFGPAPNPRATRRRGVGGTAWHPFAPGEDGGG